MPRNSTRITPDVRPLAALLAIVHHTQCCTLQALKERDAGMAAPLKKFHNKIKRLLILRFANDADSLLDIACGRGGDLHKWAAANIRYVHGFDIADEEVRSKLEAVR